MNVTIDINDYLDEDEMREIAREQFARIVRESVADRLYYGKVYDFIGNIAYEVVWPAVDEKIGCDAREAIAERIPKVIEGLSEYSVFRTADKYLREEDSVAQVILDETVRKNRPLIERRVMEIIEGLDDYRIKDEIRTAVFETVSDWLFKEDE
jgi:hypothetical protein